MSDNLARRNREAAAREQSQRAQARQETVQPREGEEEVPARISVQTWHAQSYHMNAAGDGWEIDPNAWIEGGSPPPEGATPVAPTVVDTPLVSGPDGSTTAQVGQILNCTMGNWNGEPTSYAYQWQSDGAGVGDGSSAYTVVASDSGKSIVCVVTATNVAGSGTAPPSNALVVA
jgi:hypothetical protein